MAYRDELDAARARLSSAEADLRASQEQARRERETQARRITYLEASLRMARSIGSPARGWSIALAGAAATAVTYMVALGFVAKSETVAWGLANLAIAAGMFVPSWSWGRAGELWPWLIGLSFKLAALVQWGWGWWSPMKSGIRDVHSTLGMWDAAFYFFWWAPAFVFAVALVEGLVMKRWLGGAAERQSRPSRS